ncbi:hypothetical protein BGX38DRAFT_782373 [Terfezia claveryi]|nr:hypothetical protein BGX38DRAFT_782373 [Terfezia claveryi]
MVFQKLYPQLLFRTWCPRLGMHSKGDRTSLRHLHTSKVLEWIGNREGTCCSPQSPVQYLLPTNIYSSGDGSKEFRNYSSSSSGGICLPTRSLFYIGNILDTSCTHQFKDPGGGRYPYPLSCRRIKALSPAGRTRLPAPQHRQPSSLPQHPTETFRSRNIQTELRST